MRGTITLEIRFCFPMPTFLWRYIAAQTPDIVIHSIRFFNNVTSLHCFRSRLGAPCIEKNYAQLRVLRSLQTFAESVPQILLQTYILLRTWQGFGKSNYEFTLTHHVNKFWS